ncbi:hypothetical protein [Paraburkholderia dilworthii]|uniref:hypothetical protein n=1 Tax=Paraburkholderia dilworthii TaxID=948106 RepID=UPI0012682859|nr:hypothetical protein [Paraburkholderia dilworthii]
MPGSGSRSQHCSHFKHWIATGISFCIALGVPSASFAKSGQNERKDMIVSASGHNCAFSFHDPYGGWISGNSYVVDDLPHKKTGVGDFSISFACVSSADNDSIRDYTIARYDEQKGHWQADFSGLSERDRKLLKPATQWISLKAVNSSGFGALQDMVTGDPETRSRSLGFCLLRPPVALCGSAPVVAIPHYSKVGVKPNVLRIIESIEFADAPVAGLAANRPASSPGGSSMQAVTTPR